MMSRITFDVRYDNSPGLPIGVSFVGTFRRSEGPSIKVYGDTLEEAQERLTHAIVDHASRSWRLE